MAKFIKQFQSIIHSKDAHELGFDNTEVATGTMLNDFFVDIVATVMGDDNKTYLIQWAISELDEGECDAVSKGKESQN